MGPRWVGLGWVGLGLGLTACTPVDRWSVLQVAPPLAPEPAQVERAPAAPEGPLRLTLADAVLRCLAHNPELAVQRLQAEASEAFAQIERGIYDPQLFADARFQRLQGSQVARATGQRFNVEADESRVVAGVRQALPTGTTVEATISHDRELSNRAPEQQQARLGLTVTQALLQGLGPEANLARIQQVGLDVVASRHAFRAFAEGLVAQTERRYWALALAEAQLAIHRDALAVAEQQLAAVDAQVAVGQRAEVDRAVARAEVARRRQALIDAEAGQAEARLRLLRLVAPDGAAAVTLASGLALETAPAEIEDGEARVALAVAQRPELAEAKALAQRAQLDVVAARDGLWPRLDVFVALGRSGYGDAVGQAFGDLAGDGYDASVGLSFREAVGDRAARGRAAFARASRAQADQAMANLARQVRFEVRLALASLARAQRQVAASAETRAMQALAVAAEQARFDVGLGTALELARTQRDLVAAQVDELTAVAAWRQAQVDLALADGSLLQRRGLALRAR